MKQPALTLECPRELDTLALGERIGVGLTPGALISLSGPLGAGKTVLVRGIAAGVGIHPEVVRSPTFVLHHVYRGGRFTLHHLDLYRLGAAADITLLDLDSLLEDGAVVIEWGEHTDVSRYTPLVMSVAIIDGEHRLVSLRDVEVPPAIRAAFAGAGAAR
jgi:tRNA threonylcarbamoyl adenosine modification protein YjeE